MIATELASVASKPLPEIPDGSRAAAAPTASPGKQPPAEGQPRPETQSRSGRPDRRRVPRPGDRPSSRRGGAIFLLVGAIVVVVVVVVLIVAISGGGSSNRPSSTPAAATGTGTATSTARRHDRGTTAGHHLGDDDSAKVVAQINLNPPSGTGAAKGVAFVVKAGKADGIVIEAQGVAPNSHNAYAVWLSNSPTDSVRVGFVTPGVGKNGRLQTGGALPSNAAHYKELLLTLETQNSPKTPGPVVLQGAMKGLS